MRITRKLSVLAVAATLALPIATAAQDQKSDTEAPAGVASQFGPRKKVAPESQAQPAANQPKAEVVATHGDWQVQCIDASAQGGGKVCRMNQLAKSKKNDKLSINVAVSRVKRDSKQITIVQVLAPIGVYLPTGIPVEIDGAALPNRLTYTRCLPQICEGFGEAASETVNKFKKGNNATFYVYDRPGNSYPVEVSLNGFGAAIAALDKL